MSFILDELEKLAKESMKKRLVEINRLIQAGKSHEALQSTVQFTKDLITATALCLPEGKKEIFVVTLMVAMTDDILSAIKIVEGELEKRDEKNEPVVIKMNAEYKS